MIVATDITKAHKWQWLAGLGDVTCRPYRTNGQASWNHVTHRRVRFYKKNKSVVSGLVPGTVKQRLKLCFR